MKPLVSACASRLRHQPLRDVLLCGATIAVATLLLLGRADVEQNMPPGATAPIERLAPMSASREAVPDLESLTRISDAIVVARVIAQGDTTFLMGPGGAPRTQVVPAMMSGLPPEKAVVAQTPTPTRGPIDAAAERGEIAAYPPGVPTTRFTLEVAQVLRGGATGLNAGARLTLVQVGGPVELPTAPDAPKRILPLEVEGDPLLRAGDRQVFFLARQPNGEYAAAGGPDGRFALDGSERMVAVDPVSLVGRALQGETVDELTAKLRTLAG